MKRANDGKLILFNRRASSTATDYSPEPVTRPVPPKFAPVSDQSYLENCLKKMDDNSKNVSMRLNSHIKKKLVVKNLVKPKIDEKYYEDSLQMLCSSVESIFLTGNAPQPLEKLYRTVSHLCHLKHESNTYENLHTIVESHVTKMIQNDIQPFIEDKTILQRLSSTWLLFKEKINLIRAIYLELDRTNVNGVICYSIWDMSLKCVRESLLPNNFIMSKINDVILQTINLSREHQTIDSNSFKIIIEMLDDLGYFQAKLESKILEQTRSFFYSKSHEYIVTMSLEQYIDYVRNVFKSEDEFFKSFCPMILEQNRLILSSELINEHKETILKNKNLKDFFVESRYQSIQHLNSLFQMISDGTERLNDVFFNYIRDKGIEIVKNNKDIIQDLLDFKEQTDNILVKGLNSEEIYSVSLQNAFKRIVNTNYKKVAELIAKYIDSKLRSGYKDFNEKEFEILLDKVMLFFRYNDGKDIFEAFYKQYLSKRLLIGKSASVDAEKTMLTKLKIECGQEFTVTLEGMFKDLEISRDLNENFSRSLIQSSLTPKIDMNVNTLTETNWPNRPAFNFQLPKFMLDYEQAFTKFYLSKFASRKLVWGRDLGHCLLTFYLNSTRKELQVSLFQAVILLLFNDKSEISLEDIRSKVFPTGMPVVEEELRRTLQSLACGKKETRILLKNPRGKDVLDNDKFVINNRLQNNHYRIKINQVQFKETKEEHEKTERHIIADRHTLIDANLVRIMKAKKRLHFNDLLQELFGSIKFKVTAADVKQRLETLIDRVFVRRDPDDPNIIHYEA